MVRSERMQPYAGTLISLMLFDGCGLLYPSLYLSLYPRSHRPDGHSDSVANRTIPTSVQFAYLKIGRSAPSCIQIGSLRIVAVFSRAVLTFFSFFDPLGSLRNFSFVRMALATWRLHPVRCPLRAHACAAPPLQSTRLRGADGFGAATECSSHQTTAV